MGKTPWKKTSYLVVAREPWLPGITTAGSSAALSERGEPVDEIIHTVQMAVLQMDLAPRTPSSAGWKISSMPVKGILNGHQHLRHAQADGGMAVMAAGMHKALVDGAEALAGRPVGFVLFLKYAQCVDVETHGYCGARLPQRRMPITPVIPPLVYFTNSGSAPWATALSYCSSSSSSDGTPILGVFFADLVAD